MQGPEHLTLDQAAQIFTEVLGKPVKHVRQTQDERVKHFVKHDGMHEGYAQFMAWLEVRSAEGGEEDDGGVVEKYTGVKPMGLREWVEQNKSAFI